MNIAIFDYKVSPTNPIGGCHWRMLSGLNAEHSFTVFAVEFDNPCPERIEWIRIPVPMRPSVVTFAAFHVFASLIYLWYLLTKSRRFDLVQGVAPIFLFVQVGYSQFCHRYYLKNCWPSTRPQGARRLLRWLDHRLQAVFEPMSFRRVTDLVVPCPGLAGELQREYPFTQNKLHVIPNPVDTTRMTPANGFDRNGFRAGLRLEREDILLVFAALGHFERKGLPLVLDALKILSRPELKLVVVGGQQDLVAGYRDRVTQMGLEGAVQFVGNQSDVRPFLWAGDAFAFPSFYEAFSLASLEAAAAGLPLIVAPINGVEDFVEDGVNGFLVSHDAPSVAAGISRFLALSSQERAEMSNHIRRGVQRFETSYFVEAWRKFYNLKAAGSSAFLRSRGEDAKTIYDSSWSSSN